MYPPRTPRRGQDPVADFLGSSSPETDAGLRGTRFDPDDNPVERFLAPQPAKAPLGALGSLKKFATDTAGAAKGMWHDWIEPVATASPISADFVRETAAGVRHEVDQDIDARTLRGEPLTPMDYVAQFGAGAAEGALGQARSLSSVSGAASMLPVGRAATTAGPLMQTARPAMNALSRAAGATFAVEGAAGAMDTDLPWWQRGLSAANALLGVHQAARPGPRAATEPSWGTPENPPTRPAPEPVRPMPAEPVPSPVATVESPAAVTDAGYGTRESRAALRQQYADAVIADDAAKVAELEAAMNAPAPAGRSAAPPAPEPVTPLPTPAAPASPPVQGFTPAEKASLRKQGFDEQQIADLAAKGDIRPVAERQRQKILREGLTREPVAPPEPVPPVVEPAPEPLPAEPVAPPANDPLAEALEVPPEPVAPERLPEPSTDPLASELDMESAANAAWLETPQGKAWAAREPAPEIVADPGPIPDPVNAKPQPEPKVWELPEKHVPEEVFRDARSRQIAGNEPSPGELELDRRLADAGPPEGVIDRRALTPEELDAQIEPSAPLVEPVTPELPVAPDVPPATPAEPPVAPPVVEPPAAAPEPAVEPTPTPDPLADLLNPPTAPETPPAGRSMTPKQRAAADRAFATKQNKVPPAEWASMSPLERERFTKASRAHPDRSAMTRAPEPAPAAPESPATSEQTVDDLGRQIMEEAEKIGAQGLKAGKVIKPFSGGGVNMGLGGLEKLYTERPDLFWQSIRMAGGGLVGGVVGSQVDDEDPLRGMLMGIAGGVAVGAKGGAVLRALAAKAPRVAQELKDLVPEKLGGTKTLDGPPLVRKPRDAGKDMNWEEMYGYGQPHRSVPETWKKLLPVEEEMQEALASLPPNAPPKLVAFTKKLYVKEQAAIIQADAKAARAAKLPHNAAYLDAMVDAINHVPIRIAKGIEHATRGHVGARAVEKAFGYAERVLYTKLIGGALDTGVQNLTQMGFTGIHTGWGPMVKGLRLSTTAEGRALTQHFDLPESFDPTTFVRMKPSTLRKVINGVMSPIGVTDKINRKVSFLAVNEWAQGRGLSKAEAHEFAMEITAQTQGETGQLGANPFHRQLGPLRMFSKYPSIWTQMAIDIATHPDPAVRRRGLAYMTGVTAGAYMLGVNAVPFLVPRLYVGGAAVGAAMDVGAHVSGTADHTVSEDAKTMLRYPAKVIKEGKDFARYGLGDHPQFDRSGAPSGSHTPTDALAALLGFETTHKADATSERNAQYDFAADKQRRQSIVSRTARGDLRQAIESGDVAGAAEIAKRLTPQQVRDFYKQNGKTPRQLMRERVPAKDRAEFDRRFPQ